MRLAEVLSNLVWMALSLFLVNEIVKFLHVIKIYFLSKRFEFANFGFGQKVVNELNPELLLYVHLLLLTFIILILLLWPEKIFDFEIEQKIV